MKRLPLRDLSMNREHLLGTERSRGSSSMLILWRHSEGLGVNEVATGENRVMRCRSTAVVILTWR
jgi:hypothetical protein